MFSQAYVKNSVHRGGACMAGGRGGDVRGILLECILVTLESAFLFCDSPARPRLVWLEGGGGGGWTKSTG